MRVENKDIYFESSPRLPAENPLVLGYIIEVASLWVIWIVTAHSIPRKYAGHAHGPGALRASLCCVLCIIFGCTQ